MSEVTLVRLQPEHAEKLYAKIDENRADLAQHFAWVEESQGSLDTKAYLQKVQGEPLETGCAFGVFLGEELIGCMGLAVVEGFKSALELGYWIAKSYQGKGLASKAAIELCSRKDILDSVKWLLLRVDSTNMASIRVAQKVGFRFYEELQDVELHGRHFDRLKVYKKILWESQAFKDEEEEEGEE